MSAGYCRSACVTCLACEKVDIYHRRIVRLYARQKRHQRLRAWRRKAANVTAALFIELITVSAFMALLCLS